MEVRGTEIAISLWKQKAERFGEPPPLAEFGMAGSNRPFSFLVCADLLVSDDSVFLDYGSGLARLFGLPERPSWHMQMISCVPDRYRFLLLQGCREAIVESVPVRFGGEVAVLEGTELYRACFMPLKMRTKSTLAIYGSFNFRFFTSATLAKRQRSVDTASAGALTGVPLFG